MRTLNLIRLALVIFILCLMGYSQFSADQIQNTQQRPWLESNRKESDKSLIQMEARVDFEKHQDY